MPRYIDADVLLKRIIKQAHIVSDNQSRCEGLFLPEIQKNIVKMPSADVQEVVVHGYWKSMYVNAENECTFRCSRCKQDVVVKGQIGFEYCPHCGAKMDGGNDESAT